jgi:hypothetical protein
MEARQLPRTEEETPAQKPKYAPMRQVVRVVPKGPKKTIEELAKECGLVFKDGKVG